MGVLTVRRLGELGPDVVLAPERHDPRRAAGPASVRLADLVALPGGLVRSLEGPALVLDTGHAREGFVLPGGLAGAGPLGSAKRALRPGDVIVSRLRPYLRQVAWLDPGLFALARGGNAVVASTEFLVLRARPGGPDPASLVPYLLSDAVQAALAAGQEGGHHPRFPRALLAELPVPEPVAAPAVAAAVRAHAEALRSALAGMAALTRATTPTPTTTGS